jgi:PAS domain S-box-containing protein
MKGGKKTGDVRSWSEGWMRVFLETAVDAIIVIDSRGLIESFNPAAERMFGYRDVDVVGMNVSLLMPAPYEAEHDGYLASFRRTGSKKIIGIGRDVEARRKDGGIFPIHLSVAELELNGELRFTGIIRDLTQERKTRAREADTARILETSLNEIYVFDAQTLRFVQVNHGARSNLGYSMEELLELTPLDLEPELDEASFQALLQPLRDGELERVGFATKHMRKDGSVYPVEVQVQLTTFEGQHAFVAMILDTSERDQLQREYLHAQKLEAVGRLAGGLAHDFNNLLMGVISGCRMATRMVEHDEATTELLDEIGATARKGAGITRQLLDFSRKRPYETTPCDLSAIVSSNEGMFRKLLGEDVELAVSLELEASTVLADPAKIEQILMNLVVNARDAMPGGGRIGIGVSRSFVTAATSELRPGPHVELSVSDTGCGMDEDTQAKAFEPFFTTKPMGKGTGLGLSTVFGLTREFKGHVEIESAPGRGSTFRLRFPEVEPASEPTPGNLGLQTPGGTETVLVVEDAPLVRAGIRSLLQDLGYTVHAAPDAKAALEKLAELPGVDVMLTDIVMPGMSGPELARRAQATHPEMRVLFMSAFSGQALIEQGRLQSGMPVIEKPFEEEELARRIRELLLNS